VFDEDLDPDVEQVLIGSGALRVLEAPKAAGQAEPEPETEPEEQEERSEPKPAQAHKRPAPRAKR
jgi:hypothetical protein